MAAPKRVSYTLDMSGSALTFLDMLGKRLVSTTQQFRELASVVIVAQGLQNMGRQLQRLGDTLLRFSVGNTLNEFRDLQKGLEELRFVTRAVGEEFIQLRNIAIQTGIETVFSPTEATQGLYELASAGLDARESMEALNAVLNVSLMSGGRVGMGDAAATIAVALQKFQLEATDAMHVADVMGYALQESMFHMEDFLGFLDSLKAAPALAQMDIETTLAIAMALRNMGNSARQAGENMSGLVSAFARMTAVQSRWDYLQAQGRGASRVRMTINAIENLGVEIFDASDKMRPMVDILTDVLDRMGGLTDKELLRDLRLAFGQQGVTVLTSLAAGGEDLNEIITELRYNTGGLAEEFSEAMSQTLDGAEKLLEGSKATFNAILGEAVVPLRIGLLGLSTDSLNVFNDLMRQVPAIASLTAGVSAFSGAMLKMVGLMGVISGGIIQFMAPIPMLYLMMKVMPSILRDLRSFAFHGIARFQLHALRQMKGVEEIAQRFRWAQFQGGSSRWYSGRRDAFMARAAEALAKGDTKTHALDMARAQRADANARAAAARQRTAIQSASNEMFSGSRSGIAYRAQVLQSVVRALGRLATVALVIETIWATFDPAKRVPMMLKGIADGFILIGAAVGKATELLNKFVTAAARTAVKFILNIPETAIRLAIGAIPMLIRAIGGLGIVFSRTILAVKTEFDAAVFSILDAVLSIPTKLVDGTRHLVDTMIALPGRIKSFLMDIPGGLSQIGGFNREGGIGDHITGTAQTLLTLMAGRQIFRAAKAVWAMGIFGKEGVMAKFVGPAITKIGAGIARILGFGAIGGAIGSLGTRLSAMFAASSFAGPLGWLLVSVVAFGDPVTKWLAEKFHTVAQSNHEVATSVANSIKELGLSPDFTPTGGLEFYNEIRGLNRELRAMGFQNWGDPEMFRSVFNDLPSVQQDRVLQIIDQAREFAASIQHMTQGDIRAIAREYYGGDMMLAAGRLQSDMRMAAQLATMGEYMAGTYGNLNDPGAWRMWKEIFTLGLADTSNQDAILTQWDTTNQLVSHLDSLMASLLDVNEEILRAQTNYTFPDMLADLRRIGSSQRILPVASRYNQAQAVTFPGTPGVEDLRHSSMYGYQGSQHDARAMYQRERQEMREFMQRTLDKMDQVAQTVKQSVGNIALEIDGRRVGQAVSNTNARENRIASGRKTL